MRMLVKAAVAASVLVLATAGVALASQPLESWA